MIISTGFFGSQACASDPKTPETAAPIPSAMVHPVRSLLVTLMLSYLPIDFVG
jgi:hypothetical protein